MKYSILIIEDNKDMSKIIYTHLLKSNFFDIKGIAKDGTEGIDMILKYKPDIIILDIIMPKTDGLEVLDILYNINNMNITKIILTGISNDILLNKILDKGADYIIIKPFDVDLISNRAREIHELKMTSLPKVDFKCDIIDTSKLLRDLGMRENLIGYKYILCSVNICLEDDSAIENLKNNVYPKVAEKFNTKALYIEKSIRNVINCSWNDDSPELYKKLISYSSKDCKKPKIKELLSLLVEKQKNKKIFI